MMKAVIRDQPNSVAHWIRQLSKNQTFPYIFVYETDHRPLVVDWCQWTAMLQ